MTPQVYSAIPAGAKGNTPSYSIWVTGSGVVQGRNNHTGVTDHTGATTDAVLSAVLTDLGSTAATISFSDDTHVFAANVTVPTNVGIEAIKGTLLSQNSGVTLTINGNLDAGPYQVFGGAGTVALGPLASINARSEWFGAKFDGTTDDTAAHQALINALSVGGTWMLPGRKSATGQLSIPKLIHIVGQGSNFTTVAAVAGATGPLLNIDPATAVSGPILRGVTIDLTNAKTIVGVGVTNITHDILRDVQVLWGTVGVDGTTSSGILEDVVCSGQSTAFVRWQADGGYPEFVRGRGSIDPSTTLNDGVLINRTTTTDSGGLHFHDYKINGAGGTTTRGGITVISTASGLTPVYIQAEGVVSDSVAPGQALYLSNVSQCNFENYFFSPQNYGATVPTVALYACQDVYFGSGQLANIGLYGATVRVGISPLARLISSWYALYLDATYVPGGINIQSPFSGTLTNDFTKLAKAGQVPTFQSGFTIVSDSTQKASMLALMDGGSGKVATLYNDLNSLLHFYNNAGTGDRATLSDAGLLKVTDKIVAAGGYRQTLDGWYQNAVAASQGAVPLSRSVTGPSDNIAGWIALRAGSVTGVAIHSSAACTAGSATAIIAINGSTFGTAVINTTNTTFKATTYLVGSSDFAFNAGDVLSVKLTTTSDWLPTTANIRVALEVQT